MNQKHEELIPNKPNIKPVSKLLTYFYIYFTCVTVAILLILFFSINEGMSKEDLFRYRNGLFSTVILYGIVASILSRVLKRKILNSIQDEEAKTKGGCLGWSIYFNKIRDKYSLNSPKMSTLLGLSISIKQIVVIIGLPLAIIASATLGERYKEKNEFYVIREGNRTLITNQSQIGENEQLYRIYRYKVLPGSFRDEVEHAPHTDAPTEQEYKIKHRKYMLMKSLPIILLSYYSFLGGILFYLKAVTCINKLYQKLCLVKQYTSYAAIASFFLSMVPICVWPILLVFDIGRDSSYHLTVLGRGIYHLWIIMYILAFVFGLKAWKNIRKTNGILAGRGLALTGIIISSFVFILFFVCLTLVLWSGDNANSDKARVMATKQNLKALHWAVWEYFKENNRFPTEEEGLKVLLKNRTNNNDTNEFARHDKFTDTEKLNRDTNSESKITKEIRIVDFKYRESTELPKDGWGRDFIYKLHPDSNAFYVIISLGADGKTGGDGYNSDLLSIDIANNKKSK